MAFPYESIPHATLPPRPLAVVIPNRWALVRRAIRHRPRLWTMWVGLLMMICVLIVAQIVVLIAAMLIEGTSGGSDLNDPAWIDSMLTRPGVVFPSLIAGQLVFLCTAIFGAAFSREAFRDRLLLRRGRYAWWALPIFTASVMMAWSMPILSAVIMSEFGGMDAIPTPPHFDMMFSLITSGSGFLGILVLLSLSVVPGVAEELLFRGFMLRRLLQRWHPVAAIAVTSVCFAVIHGHPLHAIGVMPLSIFLSVITWRTGSVIPAIVIHTVNNFGVVLIARLVTDPTALATESARATALGAAAIFFLIGLSALTTSIVLLVRMGGRTRRSPSIVFGEPRQMQHYPRRDRTWRVMWDRPSPRPPVAHPSFGMSDETRHIPGATSSDPGFPPADAGHEDASGTGHTTDTPFPPPGTR